MGDGFAIYKLFFTSANYFSPIFIKAGGVGVIRGFFCNFAAYYMGADGGASAMTTLDIIILIVFAGSVLIGFRSGLLKQVGSLGGLVAGVVLCRLGSAWLTAIIAGPDAPTYTDIVLAHLILFIAGFCCVKTVAHFCRQLTHALSLGIVDRLGGVVFCLFEWMLVLSLILNLWLLIKPQTSIASLSTLANGHAAPAIVALAPKLLGWALGGS